MAKAFTPEQEKAISCTDKTLLLSAAAGSGKTATLTERLIRMLTRKENPLDVSRMLVVTFTRAAAEELRVRIAAAIDEKLREVLAEKTVSAEHESTVRHLQRSSLLMPSAKIRTIDSFCNDLVKGHTETLGIKPRYRIPDEAEAKLLAEELLDEVIFDAYEGTYAPEGLDIAALVECAVDAKNEKDLSVLLFKLYKQLSGYPDGLSLIKESAEAMERESALPFFETRWGKVIKKKAIRMLTDYTAGLSRALLLTEDDALFVKQLSGAFRFLSIRARELLSAANTSYSALCAAFEAPLKEKSDAPAGDDKLTEAALAAKHYRQSVMKALENFKSTYLVWEEKDISEAMRKNAALGRSVYLLLAEFDRRFAAEKRTRGLCTFGDLEHFAYKLLWDKSGERTPLARELAASFDAICIDEYQDVNDLQHLVFEAISTPTNRFMVGDIKQSIYAFRGAKPDIFARLRKSFPAFEENASEAVLYLTKNFRSIPPLIDFNNGVFDFLFGELGESIGYERSDRLDAGARMPDIPSPKPAVYYLHKPAHSEYTEWDMLAQKISDLLKNGKIERSQKEKDEGKTEKVTPSDIAILYRQGAAKRFEICEALTHYGIPVSTEDTRNFFLSPEILLALCLLHAVNNPHRDIYLVGLLRSPLYAFTMDELILVKRERKSDTVSLYDALRLYTEENPDFAKGKRVLGDLEKFREMAKNMPSDRLCSYLFHESALYALSSAEGRERLDILYECARSFEAGRFHGLFRFVSHLEELFSSGMSIGEGRMLGGTDGVKVTTMHRSKGLEYPITFIVSTCSPGGDSADKDIPFHAALGVAMKVRDESGYALLDNPILRAVEARMEEEGAEEELRVLYVALTRAVQQMYITGSSISRPQKIMLDALVARYFPSHATLAYATNMVKILAATYGRTDLCDLFCLGTEDISLPEKPECENEEKKTDGTLEKSDTDEESVQEASSRLKERFDYEYPHTPLSDLPSKISVSRLYPSLLDEPSSPLDKERDTLPTKESAEEKPRRESVPFFLSGFEEDAAAKAGTATHIFLQFCRFEALDKSVGGTACERVEKELKRLLSGGFIHPADAARVRVGELAAFAESELLSRILRASRVHREFRFNAMLPASLFSKKDKARYESLKVFTQGVIDLIIENADGTLTLCDYKTDRLKKEWLENGSRAGDELAKKHASQLFYYAEAIERIFGKRPARIELYSLHAGKSFEIHPIL